MSTPFIHPSAVSSSLGNVPVDSVKDALHESERRFSAIVSSIPGLVFQMHMAEDGQVVFTYLSEGCEALLGIPAARSCIPRKPNELGLILSAGAIPTPLSETVINKVCSTKESSTET